MNRGIVFRTEGGFNSKILFSILNCINIENYTWYYVDTQSEVWASTDGEDFFKSRKYTGKEFSDLIKQKYYVIFLKLQGYKEKHNYYEIHTYEDFLKSDCQIIVLAYDNNFFELYLKDEKLTEVFYNHLKTLADIEDLQYITDDSYSRNNFDFR